MFQTTNQCIYIYICHIPLNPFGDGHIPLNPLWRERDIMRYICIYNPRKLLAYKHPQLSGPLGRSAVMVARHLQPKTVDDVT